MRDRPRDVGCSCASGGKYGACPFDLRPPATPRRRGRWSWDRGGGEWIPGTCTGSEILLRGFVLLP